MKTYSKVTCLVFFLHLHLLLINTQKIKFSYENENLHIGKYVTGMKNNNRKINLALIKVSNDKYLFYMLFSSR